MDEGEREAKREKNDEDDGEEMEIEDDDDSNAKPSTSPDFPTYQYYPVIDSLVLLHHQGAIPQAVKQASARLLCSNLPQEVTDDVLSVLFQQSVMFSFATFRSVSVIDVIIFEGTKASKQLRSPNHQHPIRRGRESKWHKFYSIRRIWPL